MIQQIVVSNFNILKRLLNFISIQNGCYFSRMTGSGSVCFGIFKSKKSAISGLKRIKKKSRSIGAQLLKLFNY